MKKRRKSMQFDVVVIGGGPAGLASAIRLKQLFAQEGIWITPQGGEGPTCPNM